MTTYPPPICLMCKHNRGAQDNIGATCDAFPDGIPEAILTSEFIHTQSHPGDHGIQFEPIEDQ